MEYKRNSVNHIPVTQQIDEIRAGQLQIAIIQNVSIQKQIYQ
jgi:hypothetical protein